MNLNLSRSFRNASSAFIVVFGCMLLTSCIHNTLAQDLAYERWQKCDHFPTIRLQRIDTDGQIWYMWVGNTTEVAAINECLKKASIEQASQRKDLSPPVATIAAAQSKPSPTSQPTGMIPAWRRGDEWAFRTESPQSQGTFVWSVDREDAMNGEQYYVLKSGTTREIYFRKLDFAYLMDRVNGEVESRNNPPARWVPSPLVAGEKWEVKYTNERPRDRQTTEVVMACEAVAEEQVTVPAGSFNALRVVCKNGRTGNLWSETWYAMAVKQMVREKTYFSNGLRTRELIAFKIQ